MPAAPSTPRALVTAVPPGSLPRYTVQVLASQALARFRLTPHDQVAHPGPASETECTEMNNTNAINAVQSLAEDKATEKGKPGDGGGTEARRGDGSSESPRIRGVLHRSGQGSRSNPSFGLFPYPELGNCKGNGKRSQRHALQRSPVSPGSGAV